MGQWQPPDWPPAGHGIPGLDVDEGRIRTLRGGRIPFYEPGLQECLASEGDGGSLQFLQSEEFSGGLRDITLIATGAPADAEGAPDLRPARAAGVVGKLLSESIEAVDHGQIEATQAAKHTSPLPAYAWASYYGSPSTP